MTKTTEEKGTGSKIFEQVWVFNKELLGKAVRFTGLDYNSDPLDGTFLVYAVTDKELTFVTYAGEYEYIQLDSLQEQLETDAVFKILE